MTQDPSSPGHVSVFIIFRESSLEQPSVVGTQDREAAVVNDEYVRKHLRVCSEGTPGKDDPGDISYLRKGALHTTTTILVLLLLYCTQAVLTVKYKLHVEFPLLLPKSLFSRKFPETCLFICPIRTRAAIEAAHFG